MKPAACIALLFFVGCARDATPAPSGPYVIVLGIAQDAGYPQAACRKECCARAWADPAARRHVACLAIVDPESKQRWLLDCTPDFRDQLRLLDEVAPVDGNPGLAGIFLTHAHIGHYLGLAQVGREVIGAKAVPTYAMPRMRKFLQGHGPWSQLLDLKNIELRALADGTPVKLNERITVTPMLVPHRDEFSETVCFVVKGPGRSVLFLPDIDKWEKWKTPVEDVLADVDVAYVDGTFYANGELPGRDMSEIPHPFIEESLARFAKLPEAVRRKIRFIHLNHTNPALDPDGDAARAIRAAGHAVARQGEQEPIS